MRKSLIVGALVIASMVAVLLPSHPSVTGGGTLCLESHVALAATTETSYQAGNEVVGLRDQYSKTFLTEDGNLRWSPFIESQHYKDGDGNFQSIDTSIVASSKPNWDWEVATGHWQLFINNDTTLGVKKGSNWVGHKLHAVGYYDASTKDYVILQTTNTVTPIVSANKIVWVNIIGGVDYQITYTNDSLKEDIIVKQAARNWLNQAGHRPQDYGFAPTTTYVGAVFECDWSQGLPMKLKSGLEITPDDDETEEAIYFEADAEDPYWKTKLVSFLPAGSVVSENPINPEDPEEEWEYASEVIRKRFYNQGGKHWLVLGARVIPLNQMPEGSIIFDPTETLRPNAAGDETSIYDQFPASGAHWDKVDEETADETTTYVYNSIQPYQRDLYNLPAHSEGSGTINKITVYFHCKTGNVSYGKAKASIKSDSTVTDGTEKTFAVVNTWETFSQEWATNPADSAAWEWADIDALQIGVSLQAKVSFYTTVTHCTQVYVEVDYTVGAEADISNVPITWSIGTVATSTDYWSSGSAPTWPLDDGECHFTVTNNGGQCSIAIKATNFTGGVGWTLAGTPAENTVTMKAGKSGDANEAAMVTLTTSEQPFISGLAGSATKKWELKLESATSHTDGAAKSSTVTLTATLD